MSRLAKLRQKMREKDIDAFVSLQPENRQYLSGFTGSSATLFVTNDKAYLLTDFRYVEQAGKQAQEFEVVNSGYEPFASLADLGRNVRRIGFEGDFLTYLDYLKLQDAFSKAELISASEVVTDLRSIKDAEEIALIRQAVRIADDAFTYILNFLKPGQTEQEIAIELEFYLRRAGASGPSFDFIAASGWRSALPHGVASDKKVQKGEILTMDFGAIFKGYCSDITRTVLLGEPDEKQREIYDLVLNANKAGIKAAAPGKAGKAIDAVARGVIADAGYGEYFGHGLGHSVGLAIHEGPNLNTRETKLLEPGMIVTVEPGIYIPDWGGVRIEDMVLITESGCEVLTNSPKELIIID